MHYSIFLIFLFFFFCISTNSLPPPSHNLTFYGDAHFRNDGISLTQDHPCHSSSSTFGRALYFRPFRFLDPKTNSTASFSSRFIFSIIQSPLCPPADGLAFLITSSPDSFSLSDGFMGLPGPALNPRDSFVAVEFDTNYDSSLQDPAHGGDHVGVDVNTIVSSAVTSVSGSVDLKSGKEITAWIDYSDSSKSVQVWLSYSQSRPTNPILVAKVDLSDHFKEFMFVGFSASNGQGSAVQFVTHWRFNTYGYPSFNSSMASIDEGNCVVCFPTDDDHDHEQNNSSHGGRNRGKNLALGIGGLAALVVSMILILIVSVRCLLRRRLQWSLSTRRRTLVNSVPSKMSIWEIKSATMGFSRARIVGEGASATVYKGSLPGSSAAVAIKRFNRAGIDCTRNNPFVTEFATMAGCLKHKNLVQLRGWCCEGPELVLVYEYFPNGSLDRILHKNGGSVVLTWKQRLNILSGVASALSYLHEECERQIIHRDVKACNILLDSEFNAKLGDFGLAEVYEHEHSSLTRDATIPAGTMGYLAPEYVYCGVPTQKSDVYSFGVVVLEVATGRRPVEGGGGGGMVLVDWVWGCWERGKLIEVADPKLNGEYSVGEMERVLIVGVACVHPNPEKRPSVKEAGRILKGEALLPALPARKPKVGFQYGVAAEEGAGAGAVANAVVVSREGDQSPGTDDMSWMSPMSHFGLSKDVHD